ncbi:MAG: hypothetical protein PUP46_04820 [Endozoicomonas sp. (ex Botrylloides leachii)]|nr:hypothetical protein [Endozoicomonas sp. (ex Botrylloides leachii)]
MPIWDNGNFCRDLLNIISNVASEVFIIDSTSVFTKSNPNIALNELILVIKSLPIELNISLIGFALGGTLAQYLSCHLSAINNVISISGPSFQTPELNKKLSQLIFKLKSNRTSEAMNLLCQWVDPKGISSTIAPKIPDHMLKEAQHRLLKGFTLLKHLDTRQYLLSYQGRYLSLVGSLSQLANISNQVKPKNPLHSLLEIEHAGMRIWENNPQSATKHILNWIEK